jgi:hypothetical protein
MNFKFAAMQALIAFVAIFCVALFVLGHPVDWAFLYGGFAALLMGPVMGFLMRDVTEHVPGATPKQAADAAIAMLGGTLTPQSNGAFVVQTGFNYFWLEISCAPVSGGVELRGPANHIKYVKRKLMGA